MTNSDALMIGIDFGAKFTKVSWLLDGSPGNDTRFVNQWLSTMNQDANRSEVPSEIHYNEETGRITWGFNIPIDCEPIGSLKLLLVNQKGLPAHLQGNKNIQASHQKVYRLGKTSVEVVGDYLRELYEHSIQVIEMREGVERIRTVPIILVFSIPPTWKEPSVESLRLAAQHGGLLNRPGKTAVTFVTESHATLCSTIPVLTELSPLHNGDTVILVDLGGTAMNVSTVQLGSGRISRTTRTSGRLGGTAFVDECFENLLKTNHVDH
ncbi:hypothetical protein F5Y13DRAFT_186297 [Hypoxylon sp. FL1857]|nr:hypothetical protein F5Y13DRAFT_186297 [Hypoxylon sp. FL1857]